MATPIKAITESDLLVVNARIEGLEKRLELQQSQFLEVSNKMAVFDTLLKQSNEEARRVSQELKANIDGLKTITETQYTHVSAGISDIKDSLEALGIDGTSAAKEKVRDNFKKLVKKNEDGEKFRTTIFDGVVKWALVGFLAIVGLGISTWINQQIKKAVPTTVINAERLE